MSDRLQVYNLGLDCHVSLQDVQVNLLTAMKIRRLINKPHAITVNVYTQTQDLLEVITLYNGLKHGDESAGISSSDHKLYPTLPAY